MKDFFVSYTKKDRTWAEWIAWHLEATGYTTVIQAWDFRPGSNFVAAMQQAAAQATRTIAVLSPDYLVSRYTQPEWAAAFAQDPTGSKGLLVPVRVRECDLTGLLPQIVYIDLVGIDETSAQERLLSGVKRDRAKPSRPPRFPGAATSGSESEPAYPGQKKAPVRKATAKPVPSPKAQDSRMAGSGTWVLLNGGLFQAGSVVERAERSVELQVTVRTPEEDAALRALYPDRFRRDFVSYAYQNDAFTADVQSAERTSTKGKSVWSVVLKAAADRNGPIMEVTYNGVTPDQIAERRARLLLLNERPAPTGNINDTLLQSAIEGYGLRGDEEIKGLFPPLWKQYRGGDVPFLAAARLWAVYHLKTTYTCEHVLELALGPVRGGKLPVRFRGKRKRASSNVEPAVIEVRGTCPLS